MVRSPDQPDSRSPAAPARPRPVLFAALLAAALAATAWPLVFLGVQRGRMASDQLYFHEIVILEFARDLPWPDISDYYSATTPGYHFAVACAGAVLGGERWLLQVFGSLFTLALVGLLAWACVRRLGTVLGIALALPMAASLYVWPTAVWLLPDSAGWLGVLIVMLLALSGAQRTRTWLIGGAVLAMLVFTRQSHLWAAAMLWISAYLGASNEHAVSDPSLRHEIRVFTSDLRSRLGRAGRAVVCSLPSFAIVAGLFVLWGGLTPPAFQATETTKHVAHTGLSPSTPAFLLALFGLLGVFFAGPVVRPALALVRTRPAGVAGVLAIALAGLVILPTTYDKEAGRWTGLWNLVDRLPSFGHISPAMVALGLAGTMLLLTLAATLDRRHRWVLIAAFFGFAAAQSANSQLWQRYVEPFVLIVLAVMVARLASMRVLTRPERVSLVVGPSLLALLFAVLTAVSIVRSPPLPVAEITLERDAYLRGERERPPAPPYAREDSGPADADADADGGADGGADGPGGN